MSSQAAEVRTIRTHHVNIRVAAAVGRGRRCAGHPETKKEKWSPSPMRQSGGGGYVPSERHHINLLVQSGSCRGWTGRRSAGHPETKKENSSSAECSGQAAEVRAIRIHHVNLIVAVAVGREGDLLAIRRPRRKLVVSRMQWSGGGGSCHPNPSRKSHRCRRGRT